MHYGYLFNRFDRIIDLIFSVGHYFREQRDQVSDLLERRLKGWEAIAMFQEIEKKKADKKIAPYVNAVLIGSILAVCLWCVFK